MGDAADGVLGSIAIDSRLAEVAELHEVACQSGKAGYTDPVTGYIVMTSNYLRRRGRWARAQTYAYPCA